MEPNKIENQIREKLNSREIQPSAQAWDRLDAMLSVAEEKKTKRSFGWLYIAASILVLATLGMFFFSQKNTEIQPQNNIVGTEIKKDSVKNPTNVIQSSITVQKQENKIAVAIENKSTISNQQSININQRVSITNQKQSNQNKAQTGVAINQNQKSQTNPAINREKPIDYLINSDVAVKDIPKIETKKDISTANNKLDDFLLAGLDNTATKSVNKKSAVKVDAKSLLSQVDGELELTFREKVINKVAKNYKEVKVALANRNNE